MWRDRANLWPGENWRVKIRDAITHDALVFTACFSSHSAARQKSYQNEELMLAIDQLRLRRPDDPWLIPVCFDNCDVPDLELGAGRTLASIQRADLFGEGYDQAVARLVRTVLRILGSRHGASPATGVPAPIAADSRHRPAEPVRPNHNSMFAGRDPLGPSRSSGRPFLHLEHLRYLRRSRTAAVVAAAVVAGGVAVAIISASPHPPSGSGRPVSAVSTPITTASALPPVTGDVYVDYDGGSDSSAGISGEIKNGASGQVVRLYAQQFPYTAAPVPAESLTLNRVVGTAKYAFRVTPTLATRYLVRLFRDNTATVPLASSVMTTIYVVAIPEKVGASGCVGRPVCHLTETHIVFVPPSALKAEMSKPWYSYLGLNLSTSGEPALPAWLQLGAGDPVIAKPQLIAANEFSVTISYAFSIGNDGFGRGQDGRRLGRDGVGWLIPPASEPQPAPQRRSLATCGQPDRSEKCDSVEHGRHPLRAGNQLQALGANRKDDDSQQCSPHVRAIPDQLRRA